MPSKYFYPVRSRASLFYYHYYYYHHHYFFFNNNKTLFIDSKKNRLFTDSRI